MRALCLFFWGGLCLTTAAERFSLEHAAEIVSLSEPQVTPDGQTVVVAVTRADLKQNRFITELVRIDTALRSRKVLLNRPASQHRLSPDGKQLAYIATVDGKSQIFVMPLDGGESVRVSHSSTGVQNYAWRPDGNALAYAAPDEGPKREREEQANRSFEADVGYLATIPSRSHHLWIVPAGGGEDRRLTSGEWNATAPVWSPDGKRIAFYYMPGPTPRFYPESTLRVLDLQSGTVTSLTGRTGLDSFIRFSPDRAHFCYTWPRDGDHRLMRDVWLAPVDGGTGRNATRDLDLDLRPAEWLPDGRSVILLGPQGTRAGMWILPVTGTARRQHLGRLTSVDEVSVSANGKLILRASTADNPSELYVMDGPDATPWRLTEFNRHIERLDLGVQQSIEWTGPQSRRMDGVLTFPPARKPDQPYPLVVLIHGGPTTSSTLGFNRRSQWLASQGWIVFEPNYRGSNNLGNDFQSAIRNDAARGPGRDVMSGVDLLINRKIVDPKRMAVSGWSYGGLLTVWLLAKHPERWRAGVTLSALTDHLDQYVLGDIHSWVSLRFDGSPFISRGRLQAYRDQSPIRYAASIKSPTLILGLTGDARVPITQSYALYHVLRDNGAKVKFVVYPIAGHTPQDPVHQRDLDRRWAAWIEEHLMEVR